LEDIPNKFGYKCLVNLSTEVGDKISHGEASFLVCLFLLSVVNNTVRGISGSYRMSRARLCHILSLAVTCKLLHVKSKVLLPETGSLGNEYRSQAIGLYIPFLYLYFIPLPAWLIKTRKVSISDESADSKCLYFVLFCLHSFLYVYLCLSEAKH